MPPLLQPAVNEALSDRMSSHLSQAPIRSRENTPHAASQASSRVASDLSELCRASTVSENDTNLNVVEVSENSLSLTNQHADVPVSNTSWQQELAASRVGRHSRASSIFSTRTPLTVQSDDAQSINIEAGGQSFRISRDGSHITNTTGAPPPYPGPPSHLEELTEDSGEEDDSPLNQSRTSLDTVRDNAEESTPTPDRGLPIRTHVFPGAFLYESPSETRQSGLTIPQMLKSAFQTRWYGYTANPHDAKAKHTSSVEPQTLKSNLRRTQSESSGMPRLRLPQSHSEWCVSDDQIAVSEDQDTMTSPFLDAERQMQELHWDGALADLDEQETHAEEVSRYYNLIMRDMDKEHRRQLHERDTELARLRELLNEKDIIYRQQLRERDHVIEGLNDKVSYRDLMVNELKKNAYNLENDLQQNLEKARNGIEDIWERRWKEYETLLVERIGSARSRATSIMHRNSPTSNSGTATPDLSRIASGHTT